MTRLALLAILAGLAAAPAHAYIGPGLGAGAIATVIGVLAAMIMAIAALVWFPAKRLIARRRKRPEAEDAA